ncbi:MAG: M15 family metallopeptidase [Bacteroidia bacterium]
MRYIFFSVCILCLLMMGASCSRDHQQSGQSPASKDTLLLKEHSDSLEVTAIDDSLLSGNMASVKSVPDTSQLERNLIAQGLVNILQRDPGIQTDIKYSTTDNFLHEDVYEDFDKCYLQPEVADMLLKVQTIIKEKDSSLSLIVFDCVRPRSVQHKMWKIVKGTPQQPYVAPPGGIGSMHNYGAAVDLSLIHLDTGLVDMGTPFDFFGPQAQPRYEMDYLKKGELTQTQLQNRWLLRNAMKAAGFEVILSEWWHFNAFPAEEVRKRFVIVE